MVFIFEKKSIPNVISVCRILFIPFFVYFFDRDVFLSLLIFLSLSFSDVLDGFLARRFGWVSDFGKLVDPVADKLLVLTAFVLLVDRIPFLFFLVIFVVELLVVGGKFFVKRDVVIQSNVVGKFKMLIQFFAVIFTMLELWGYLFVVFVSVVVTVVSGLLYVPRLLRG